MSCRYPEVRPQGSRIKSAAIGSGRVLLLSAVRFLCGAGTSFLGGPGNIDLALPRILHTRHKDGRWLALEVHGTLELALPSQRHVSSSPGRHFVRQIRSLIDRLMEKVSPEPMTGCWLWTAAMDHEGHGTLRVSGETGKSHTRRADLVAYELFVGPVPEKPVLEHKCHVPCCVNPQHLELVKHN